MNIHLFFMRLMSITFMGCLLGMAASVEAQRSAGGTSPASNPSLVQANLYQLSGQDLHITYSPTGIDGKPHLTYQDATHTLTFAGDKIQSTQAGLGEIVSVTIRPTVDQGSTTFSLFVPRVNLLQGASTSVQTDGITTIHRFSIVPAFNRGQLDVYTVTPLHGTAFHVVP